MTEVDGFTLLCLGGSSWSHEASWKLSISRKGGQLVCHINHFMARKFGPCVVRKIHVDKRIFL